MPLYEYLCLEHGTFQLIGSMDTPRDKQCPQCGSQCLRRVSLPAPAVIRNTERLPYGSGSRGKFVSAEETGGLSVFVPSWGAMEQSEVDYVAEVAVAKERERVAQKRPHSEEHALKKEALGNIVKTGKNAKKGSRNATMEQVKREGLR